jgi:hypothetical protein
VLTAPDLRAFMGITSADAALDQVVTWAVATTNGLILGRCQNYLNAVDAWPATAEYAAKLQGARLVKRRASPEGVAGFGDFGPVRVTALDPDIEQLLAPDIWLAFA